MAKNNKNTEAEANEASKNNENTEVEANETGENNKNTSSKNVSNEIKALVGNKLIVNHKNQSISILSNLYANVIYNNACNTFGKQNIELVKVENTNLEKISKLLNKYQNNIIKK